MSEMMTRIPRSQMPGDRMSATRDRAIMKVLRGMRLIAGDGIRISKGPNGVVIAHSDGTRRRSGGDAYEPFSLRWRVAENDSGGKLEVYIPAGAMTTDAECVPINRPSNANLETSDEDDVEEDWYDVEDPAPNTDVLLCVMPGNHLKVKCVNESARDNDEYYSCAVVKWILGRYKIEKDADGNETVEVTSINTGAKSYQISDCVDQHAINRISYTIKGDRRSGFSVKSVKIVDAMFQAGGITLKAEEIELKESDTEVWLNIDHSTSEYSLKVETTPEKRESDEDGTLVRIYTLFKRYPLKDFRRILENIPFYR